MLDLGVNGKETPSCSSIIYLRFFLRLLRRTFRTTTAFASSSSSFRVYAKKRSASISPSSSKQCRNEVGMFMINCTFDTLSVLQREVTRIRHPVHTSEGGQLIFDTLGGTRKLSSVHHPHPKSVKKI